MTPLQTQEEFEKIWHPKQPTKPIVKPVVIYFTAKWCKPCKRIDWQTLHAAFSSSIDFMLCDIDVNDYTGGYVGCRSIPGFLMITPKKQLIGPITNSSTEAVHEWLSSSLAAQ